MASLMPNGKQQFLSTTGAPLVGGKLYTYAAGTVTPKNTFSDAAGTVPNTNPIILDGRGEALVYWTGSYKVVVQDPFGNIIYTVDNYVTDAQSTTNTLLASAVGAAMVGFNKPGAPQTVQQQLDMLYFGITNVRDSQFAGGAKGGGVTDDTAAVQAALTAIQAAGGGVLYFPSSRYQVTAGVLSISGVRLTVLGDGMNNTRLQSNSGTGAILTITQSDFTNPILVSDIAIITYTTETQTALSIIGNATDSQINRVQARCEIRNVECRGDNTATAGFQFGITISAVHNLLMNRVFVAGRNDGSGTRAGLTKMTAGVKITGSATGIPSDFTIQGCYIYQSVYGFQLTGGMEGTNFAQCYAVACDYCYYSDQSGAGTRPWAQFVSCHAAAYVACITLINVPQPTIANCLLYKRAEANSGTTAIALTNCDLANVHDNNIYNSATDYTVSGDFIAIAVGGSTNRASIHHNKMDRVQYGVNLVGTTQNTTVEANTVSTLFGSGTPAEYVNQSIGLGNKRRNNPAFETSSRYSGAGLSVTTTLSGVLAIALDTAEIGDEYLVTASVRATKDATASGIKAFVSKTSGTAVAVFENTDTQAYGYTWLGASADGYVTISTIMKISTAGSLTLNLSAAVSAGTATIATNDVQISITRK